MEKEESVQKAFEKLKGVDIFSLKSYLEKTAELNVTAIIKMVNEIIVNFGFFILNVVVGFFSLTIRLLEKVDLYGSYKKYVYKASLSIWHGFTGSTTGGVAKGSLVFLAITCLGFYLFYLFASSRGNFSKRLLYTLAVIALGFGWFGTISKTSGGLYILNTVDNFSKTAVSKLSDISVSYGDKQSLKMGDSIADSYIAETSYTAYVFVNTGQENGKYKDRQSGKEEKFDDSKVLGSTDKDGKFKAVSTSDRADYLDDLGHGADDDSEKNRWVSATWDYLFIKFFYVLFKIVEAFVIAIPIVLIQLLNILAQALVLIMILLFPVILLVSLFPKMQDLLFGAFKIMIGGLSFPAITSLLILAIFYLEKVIESFINNGFDKAVEANSSLSTFKLVFKLMISAVAKATVYFLLWKYKGELIEVLLGSRARIKVDDVERRVADGKDSLSQVPSRVSDKVDALKDRSASVFERAQHSGNFILGATGFGAGLLVNGSKKLKDVFSGKRSKFGAEKPSPGDSGIFEEEPDMPSSDRQTDSAIIEDEHKSSFNQDSPMPGSEQTSWDPEEFEDLRNNQMTKKQQNRVDKLEKELDTYQDDNAMYKAQGSNAFIRNYRKSLSKDDKIKSNLKRRDQIINELSRLRGEV